MAAFDEDDKLDPFYTFTRGLLGAAADPMENPWERAAAVPLAGLAFCAETVALPFLVAGRVVSKIIERD